MAEEKKPTLLHFRQKTSLTTQEVAQEAGVTLAEAYMVEIGGFVERELVEKVLAAFAKLSGMTLTLGDIQYQNVAHSRSSQKETQESQEYR